MKVCCRCGSLCSEQGHSSSSSINTWDYLGLTLILRSFDTYHSGSTVLGSSRFNFEHVCCEVFGIAQIPVVSILGTSPRLRASSFCRLIFFSSWLARPTWCRAMSPKGTLFSQQNVFIFVCKGPKGTQCLINCLIFCDSDIIIIILLLLLVVVLLLWLWLLLLLLLYIYILFIYGMIILLVLAKLHKAIGSSPSSCGSAFSWSCGHSQIRRCTCAVLSIGATDPVAQAIGSALSDACTTSTTIPQCPTEWDAEAGIFFKWRFSKIGDTPKPWVSNLILK